MEVARRVATRFGITTLDKNPGIARSWQDGLPARAFFLLVWMCGSRSGPGDQASRPERGSPRSVGGDGNIEVPGCRLKLRNPWTCASCAVIQAVKLAKSTRAPG